MKKQIVSTLMMAVFALLFLLSAGMLLAYYGEGARQQQAFRELERITEQADDWGGETSAYTFHLQLPHRRWKICRCGKETGMILCYGSFQLALAFYAQGFCGKCI